VSARDVILDSLWRHCEALGDDELRVLAKIAERLRMGAGVYGPLSLATDKRDWRHEAFEEAADLSVYLACALVVGEHLARVQATRPSPPPMDLSAGHLDDDEPARGDGVSHFPTSERP
jgi:hypothetical protein